MGRSGMQSFAGVLIVLSLSMLVLFNQHIAAFDWTASSSMSVTAGSKYYSVEGLHRGSLGRGDEMKRRRLQQVLAPAPSPQAAVGSGVYIGYGVLTAGYCPCPPQSGRSYYTSNCQSATGPVAPYSRGCSTISLCARD
ncbi:unnamed protein product [Calypogeia fissa]